MAEKKKTASSKKRCLKKKGKVVVVTAKHKRVMGSEKGGLAAFQQQQMKSTPRRAFQFHMNTKDLLRSSSRGGGRRSDDDDEALMRAASEAASDDCGAAAAGLKIVSFSSATFHSANAAAALNNALETNRGIETLEIFRCIISAVFMATLCDYIASSAGSNNNNLQKFRVDGNLLEDGGASMETLFVSPDTKLAHLLVSGAAIRAIVAGISNQAHNELKNLCLLDVDQGDLVAVGAAIGSNTNLEYLEFLECTGMGSDGIKALAIGMRGNKTLRALRFQNCALTLEEVSGIVHNIVQQHAELAKVSIYQPETLPCHARTILGAAATQNGRVVLDLGPRLFAQPAF